MQHHRNGGSLSGLPDPGSLEYQAQKLVLLELVVDPPRTGDRLSTLVRSLDIPGLSVEPAVAALEAIRLAARDGDTVRATPSAQYFEYLWPVMLRSTSGAPCSSCCSTTIPHCCLSTR